jgi:DNA end-binding protein Ku
LVNCGRWVDRLAIAPHALVPAFAEFEPEKFEDQYETALSDLIDQKRAGKPITPKERPAADNVVDLMEALRRSVGKEQPSKATKKPRKAAAGQKEMLLAISGKKSATENATKKTTSKPQRKSA